MSEFNFKSQLATSREQSERLLSLGLKKETADMLHYKSASMKEWGILATPWRDDCEGCKCYYPAWSLHRLIEMMPSEVKFPLSGMPEDFHFEIHSGLVRYHNGFVCCVMEGGGYYKAIIDCIEWLIKKGYFNKEYLCEN